MMPLHDTGRGVRPSCHAFPVEFGIEAAQGSMGLGRSRRLKARESRTRSRARWRILGHMRSELVGTGLMMRPHTGPDAHALL